MIAGSVVEVVVVEGAGGVSKPGEASEVGVGLGIGDRVAVVDAMSGKELSSMDTGAKPMDEKATAAKEKKDNAQE